MSQRPGSPGFDIAAHRAAARAAALAGPREAVDDVRELDLDGVGARLFVPHGARSVILHLHGGGFVLNDIDVHDAVCRRLANRARMAVLSVEYRRPPEHPFPAAPDDTAKALAWLLAHRDELGVTGRVFVHGDSAGANLALVAALEHAESIDGLVLIYPFLDPTCSLPSYAGHAEADRAEMQWYWEQYLPTDAARTDPRAAPLLTEDFSALPPTLVVTAAADPLLDEGEALHDALAEAGVEVVGTRYLGMPHGFWRHIDDYDAAEPLMWQTVGFLQMLERRRP